jgi:hypothetical protein
MGTLMATFLSFHTWLMLRGMTTIEFCEKTLSGSVKATGVSYDLGMYANVKAVLGPHWFLWLLPLSTPEGNGINFQSSLNVPSKNDVQAEPEWTGNEARC